MRRSSGAGAGSGSSVSRMSARLSLPAVVRGSAVEPNERDRDLERRQPVAAERGQGVVARVVARVVAVDHDRGDRDVAQGRVAPGDDGRIGDRGVAEEHRFDLSRRDVLAAAHDPIRPAIEHGQVAVGVDATEVAGPKPAVVGEGGGGSGRVAEVAEEPSRGADLDLALAIAAR